MTTLSDVIKLIDASNISQLARESDVSRSQLNRIKEGFTDPGLETAERILNALGFDLKVVPRQVCRPDDVKLTKKDAED